MHPTLAARSRATLLGLAWGDVLGCPVEYWPKPLIAEVYGRYQTLPERYPLERIPADPYIRQHLRPLGLHSDDTQQAIVLLHSCLQDGGWQVGRWAEQLLQGRRRKAWRGTGRNFRSAVAKIAEGCPPLQCGSDTAGIGGAMRIAPVGALYHDRPAELLRVVVEATVTTHADIRAVSLAVAVATCCAWLVGGMEAAEVRARLPDHLAGIESAVAQQGLLAPVDAAQTHAVSTTLRQFLATAWADLASLRAALAGLAASLDVDLRGMAPPSNHAFVQLGGVHAVCVGLWPGQEAPAALLSGVVEEGGDTDTVAAIAGGILGARHGDDWIPLARCSDAEMLARYADATVSGQLPEAYADFLERERRWSALERDHAAALAATPAA